MTSTAIYTKFVPEQYCVYHTTYSGTLLPPNYIGSSSVDKVLNQNYHGSVSSKRYKSAWLSELKLHPELFSTIIISYHDTRSSATHKEYQVQKLLNAVRSDLFINRAYASVNGFGDTVFTDAEKEATAKKQIETKANKSPEEKEATAKKQIETKANKSPEEKAATAKKMSDALVIANSNKTPDEKAARNKKHSDNHANRTPNQLSETRKKRSDARANRTAEEQARISNNISTASKEYFANRTPEQKEATRKKKADIELNRSPEEKSVISKKISDALKGKAKPITECPHCGLVGGGGHMKRYHFDNCKMKPK